MDGMTRLARGLGALQGFIQHWSIPAWRATAPCSPHRNRKRPRPTRTAIVPLILSFLIAVASANAEPGSSRQGEQASRYALLVGCTIYPSLPEDFQLEGPANDVELFRDFLEQRYSFPRENIVTLTENEALSERKPTRANIFRELDRLAKEVHAGDQVVLLMAGHGSQQPAQEDPDNPQPAGYEAIFLPKDVGRWDGHRGVVANAISNKELGLKIRPILHSGAKIWAIIDSCHSGAMLRGGNGKERVRQVPMQKLVPDDVVRGIAPILTKDDQKRRGTDGVGSQPAPQISLFDMPGWVATYAAQSFEPTVEKYLPPDDSDAKSHGLLSFAIVKILSEAKTALSYRELIEEIYRYYNALGRTFPTPLSEGTDLQREVLGESEPGNRAQLRLVRRDGQPLKVTAGSLNGLSKGSVLSVRPPVSEPGERTLGYVRVESTEPFEATVTPCEFNGQPAANELPDGAICRVSYRDFGEKKLSIALETSSSKALSSDLSESLEGVGRGDGSLVCWTKDAAAADWLLRIDGNEAFLLPAGGTLEAGPSRSNFPGGNNGLVGPAQVNSRLAFWVEGQLQKIARARCLLRLSTDPAFSQSVDKSVRAETLMVRYANSDDKIGRLETSGPNARELRTGDIIAFDVRNNGDGMVDVSLFYIDARAGITCLYPRIGSVEDNRLLPGKHLRTPRLKVTNDSAGLEHVVTIVVKAEGAPIDFSFLQQSSLDLSRSTDGEPRSMRMPLGQLLKSSMYGAGNTRGLAPADSARYSLQSLSWRVTD